MEKDEGRRPLGGQRKEAHQGSAEERMEDWYSTGGVTEFEEGEVVRGRVVYVGSSEVLVDVGYKSEGAIPIEEFHRSGRLPKVGDELDVYLEAKEDAEGLIVLSKEKADKIRVWDAITQAYEKGAPVEGRIVEVVKGGLAVDVGVKAFLPGSQVDLRPVKNLTSLVGQGIRAKVIKLNRRRGNVVLSRRAVLEEEREEKKKHTLEVLHEGMVLTGTVKNITDYGAFIDLGGIDGLLHVTDMSWGRVGHPSEIFQVGDQVEVVVLHFDRETGRVSLGYKQKSNDPWENVEQKFAPGTKARGRVVSLTNYGAFIELEPGVEGLVHVSEMSWTRSVGHPSEVLKKGQELDTQILNIDKENKRISLGLKQIQPDPWATVAQRYPMGSRVTGKVVRLTDFGAFIELEAGVDGLLHISQMASRPISRPDEIVNVGDEITLLVIRVDPIERRIGLSLKELAHAVDLGREVEDRGGHGRRGGKRKQRDDYDYEDEE
jgi:small subunit ribosomal protein S1